MDVLIFLIFILLVCLAVFAVVKSRQQVEDVAVDEPKGVTELERESKPVFRLKRDEQVLPLFKLRPQPTAANGKPEIKVIEKKMENANPMALCRTSCKPRKDCRHCAMEQA